LERAKKFAEWKAIEAKAAEEAAQILVDEASEQSLLSLETTKSESVAMVSNKSFINQIHNVSSKKALFGRSYAIENAEVELSYASSREELLGYCDSGNFPTDSDCSDAMNVHWEVAARPGPASPAYGCGYKCCAGLKKSAAAGQPLCGVCIRVRKGAYESGDVTTQCASAYCKSKSLDAIATECATTDTPDLLAMVANNPFKPDMADFVRRNLKSLDHSSGWYTGTATTGALVARTSGAQALFTSLSGPYGGDAQLGGNIAASMISAMVFFNDENEAHREDILRLKWIAASMGISWCCDDSPQGVSMGNARDVLREWAR
jgi:methylglyoxal synthase